MVGVARVTGDEILIAATKDARAILCRVDEVNFWSNLGLPNYFVAQRFASL